eukprot:333246-Pelagomonas_calceolata.AAC.3
MDLGQVFSKLNSYMRTCLRTIQAPASTETSRRKEDIYASLKAVCVNSRFPYWQAHPNSSLNIERLHLKKVYACPLSKGSLTGKLIQALASAQIKTRPKRAYAANDQCTLLGFYERVIHLDELEGAYLYGYDAGEWQGGVNPAQMKSQKYFAVFLGSSWYKCQAHGDCSEVVLGTEDVGQGRGFSGVSDHLGRTWDGSRHAPHRRSEGAAMGSQTAPLNMFCSALLGHS